MNSLMMLAAAIAQQAPASGELQPFTASDLNRIAEVASPTFLPDGSALLYVVTTADIAADKKTSDLWRTDWATGSKRALTRTPKLNEWLPIPSPDGKRIYFLSDGAKDETTQLWVMPGRGGRARQLTRVPGGISDYQLSPDGKRIVAVAEVGTAVAVPANGRPAPPIVVDRFRFKEDGRGRIDDRVMQLLLIDLGSGKAQQLTRGGFDSSAPSWSPDGQQIAFVSYTDEAANRLTDSDIFIVAAEPGAAPRKVSQSRNADNDPAGTPMRPSWSPDGRQIAWVTGGEAKWIYYAPHQLSVADVASGTLREVARIDRFTYSPRWTDDGRSIVALIEQDRDTWLAKIDLASGGVNYLTTGKRLAADFAIGPDGRMAVLDGTGDAPYALRSVETIPRVLADHNDWLGQNRRLSQIQDVSFLSNDGTEIHGLLMLPPSDPDKPGSKPPLVVQVHGGPVSQFSHEFQDQWQVLAAHGYSVLGVNPRGSSGRGFDFSRAIYADWGVLDVQDLKAGIDHVISRGLVDADRIGIGGWSYGGILTNYMIASDPRITAAVSGAGASNFVSLWGVDQYIREYEQELGTPWGNPDVYARVSYPFLKPQSISAPTLFLCAGADANVPCEGAEQMYQMLRSRNISTRLVVYPEENHGLTVPSYIEDRMTRTLDWFDLNLRKKQR